MASGSIINKGSDIRLVSVYCSNTAAGALNKGKVVALRYTNTTLNAETGAGFGGAVDYAIATASVAVGVLWDSRMGLATTFLDSTWAQCVTRGPLAEVFASGTVAAKTALFPSSTIDGYVDDATGDGTLPQGFVGYSIGSIADGTTDTIAVFVNTLYA